MKDDSMKDIFDEQYSVGLWAAKRLVPWVVLIVFIAVGLISLVLTFNALAALTLPEYGVQFALQGVPALVLGWGLTFTLGAVVIRRLTLRQGCLATFFVLFVVVCLFFVGLGR